ADVEVECLVLVENPYVRDVDARDHVLPSSASAYRVSVAVESLYAGWSGDASPKLLGRAHAIAKQVGTAASGSKRARNWVGLTPVMSLKVRLKVPRLLIPTSKQTSVTLTSVSRRRYIARSTLRRCR